MRARDLVWLLLIGCGDNLGAPDAGGRVDAAIDAPDAPIDGPSSDAMSRVWAVGDILVDNTTIAGAFTHGTGTLPFGPGNEPPIRIANVRAFDARGGKIAYVSDSTMAGRFDLHVADADNSNPIVVIQGGTPNVEINAVALSPDGTTVAFTMDSLLINNGYDLYLAPTTAGATGLKVSPSRPLTSLMPAEQDVFSVFTWSADGKYLAFSADLTDNNFDQAYVVEVLTGITTELLGRADIATQATGAQGVRGALLFDDQNNIYFRARIQTGSTQFQLFRATPTGARTVFALPVRGDSSTADAGAFAITPDGTKIVFSADAPTAGAYDLYVATLAAPTPAKLTSLAAAGNANFTAAMAISPDATKVALVADFLGGDGNDEPYVVHLDGSTQMPRRLINLAATCTPAGCTNVDALAVQWTADGGAIYVLGDIATSNDTRVFRVDPAMADQAPELAVTTPTSGDISTLLVRPIP